MMDVVIFNEVPRVVNVGDFHIFPADCLELTKAQFDKLKSMYPGFVHEIEAGGLTVYDSKKDAETIEARLRHFKSLMEAEKLPPIKHLPGEPWHQKDVELYGARTKKKYMESRA